MNKKGMRNLFFVIVVLCFALPTIAQPSTNSKEDIQKRAQELLNQIENVRKSLDATKKNKKETLAQLALIQQKIKLRNQLIRNINGQIDNIDENIKSTKTEINQLKKDLDTLKIQYAKSMVYAYKNRSNYDMLNFIFSSTNFNDALKRITYLQAYRKYREHQVNTIKNTKELLQDKYASLTKSRKRKDEALENQNNQKQELQVEKDDKAKIVTTLQKKEKELVAEITAREKQRLKLRNTLAAIIKREKDEAIRKEKELAKRREEERKKQEALAKQNATNPSETDITKTTKSTTKPSKDRTYSVFETTAEGLATSTSFEKNRGHLPWPINSGIVVGRYGKNAIEGTSLTEINDGIRIETSVGTTVKSVFEGTVTGIFDLDGESTVFIRHGKYLTAYSNLESVSVSKGQQIKAGQAIGKVAASLNGSGELTFMISNDNNRFLNPLDWLKPK